MIMKIAVYYTGYIDDQYSDGRGKITISIYSVLFYFHGINIIILRNSRPVKCFYFASVWRTQIMENVSKERICEIKNNEKKSTPYGVE